MPRYKIIVEYDGTPFVGWQMQDNGPSVAGALTNAIERFASERPLITGAGRTDAGVHALAQVAHFDLAKDWDTDTVRDALNAHLRPQPVAVLAADRVADDFSARFSAVKRHYRYRIVNRRGELALERDRAWRIARPLDAEAMQVAARRLVGNHDFTTFRSAECQAKSPIKTLDVADVRREGEFVLLTFASRSFLHRQVRSMTGTLAEVGIGRWTKADVAKALAAKDRQACGPVAPSDGLYLTGVGY